jgi:hypothetical protein
MSVGQQARDWGTLGVPDSETGAAKLLHLVRAPGATLRHGFYESGAAIPHHSHELDSLVYGVGGPAIEASGTGRVVKRRLMFHPAGYAHSLSFCGPTHVLAIELPALAAPGRMRPSASTPLPATLYDRVWRVMLRIAENEPQAAIAAALGDLIDGAGAFMAEPKPAWLWAIVDHLHADWRNTASVRALSRRFGVSAQPICRTFKG